MARATPVLFTPGPVRLPPGERCARVDFRGPAPDNCPTMSQPLLDIRNLPLPMFRPFSIRIGGEMVLRDYLQEAQMITLPFETAIFLYLLCTIFGILSI